MAGNSKQAPAGSEAGMLFAPFPSELCVLTLLPIIRPCTRNSSRSQDPGPSWARSWLDPSYLAQAPLSLAFPVPTTSRLIIACTSLHPVTGQDVRTVDAQSPSCPP